MDFKIPSYYAGILTVATYLCYVLFAAHIEFEFFIGVELAFFICYFTNFYIKNIQDSKGDDVK